MKTKLFHLVLTFAITMILVPDLSAQAIAYYAGTVKNTDNQPVDSVEVRSGADQTYGDMSGNFILGLTELESDTVGGETFTFITFTDPRYETLTQRIDINPGDSLINNNIILEPKQPTPSEFHTVSGKVLFEDNQPVPFMEVAFLHLGARLEYLSTTTNEQGEYSYEVREGPYYIRSAARYTNDPLWAYRFKYYNNADSLADADLLEVTSDLNNIDFIHPLLKEGSISGRITDAETGEPVELAEVWVYGLFNTDSVIIATDPDGNYTLNVFEGEYLVFSWKEGYNLIYYQNATIPFEADHVFVTADNLNVTGIDIALVPQGDGTNSISGFVYNQDGQPLPDVQIYLVPLDSGNWYNNMPRTDDQPQDSKRLMKTDNNGAYNIGKVKNGNYCILFYKEKYLNKYYGNTAVWEDAEIVSLTGNTNLSGINATLQMLPLFGGEVNGIVSYSGSAVSGTLLSAYDQSDELTATAVSEHDGGFSLQLLNGTYTLKASRVGYATTEYSGQLEMDLESNPVITGIDIQLTETPSSSDKPGAPMTYKLDHNVPNPFNPATTISFSVAKAGLVTLKVYDILGNEVAVLVNDYLNQGEFHVEFNASSAGTNLSSGIYFYRLQADGFTAVKKMILLK